MLQLVTGFVVIGSLNSTQKKTAHENSTAVGKIIHAIVIWKKERNAQLIMEGIIPHMNIRKNANIKILVHIIKIRVENNIGMDSRALTAM